MKHGRPLPDEAWEAEDGWRRCHSQMVWQAIQAVLTLAVVDDIWHQDTCRGSPFTVR